MKKVLIIIIGVLIGITLADRDATFIYWVMDDVVKLPRTHTCSPLEYPLVAFFIFGFIALVLFLFKKNLVILTLVGISLGYGGYFPLFDTSDPDILTFPVPLIFAGMMIGFLALKFWWEKINEKSLS